jgi:hypothetical protein
MIGVGGGYYPEVGVSKLTPDGGLAVRMTNKTGAATSKGELVECHGTIDNAVRLTEADAFDCIGVMYEDGIADGQECWIVISGRAQVALKNETESINDGWVSVSDVSGRALASGSVPSPPTAAEHFMEIGHCHEAKSAGAAGVKVLAYCFLHFN